MRFLLLVETTSFWGSGSMVAQDVREIPFDTDMPIRMGEIGSDCTARVLRMDYVLDYVTYVAELVDGSRSIVRTLASVRAAWEDARETFSGLSDVPPRATRGEIENENANAEILYDSETWQDTVRRLNRWGSELAVAKVSRRVRIPTKLPPGINPLPDVSRRITFG